MEAKTLLDIRTLFCKFSGRMDLASADFTTDSGADFFIQAGQDYLDREVGNERNSPFYTDWTITEGIKSVTLFWVAELSPSFISADRVFISGGPESIGFTELEYKEVNQLYEDFPDWDDTENDQPAYWGWELEAHESMDSLSFSTIRIMPPADGTYTVRIFGTGLDKPLLNNTDMNSWTIYHPNVLLAASFFQLYSFTGEQEKRDGAFKVMTNFMKTVDKTLVERELKAAREQVI